MSQNMISPVAEVGQIVPSRYTVSPTGATGQPSIAHNLLSISRMDEILLDAPFAMSQSRLDKMTLNDKQSFIRTALSNAEIVSTDLLPLPTINVDTDPVAEVEPYGTIWVNEATPEVFQTDGEGNWISQWSGAA